MKWKCMKCMGKNNTIMEPCPVEPRHVSSIIINMACSCCKGELGHTMWWSNTGCCCGCGLTDSSTLPLWTYLVQSLNSFPLWPINTFLDPYFHLVSVSGYMSIEMRSHLHSFCDWISRYKLAGLPTCQQTWHLPGQGKRSHSLIWWTVVVYVNWKERWQSRLLITSIQSMLYEWMTASDLSLMELYSCFEAV